MIAPSYLTEFFWGVADWPAFNAAARQMIAALAGQPGVVMSDNLVALGRTLGFTRDERLMAAFNTHATEVHERGILWRTATLVWAARQALRLEGDFVECGTYRGTSARILLDAADLSDRRFYLYDLFDHAAGDAHQALPAHGSGLYETVQRRFSDFSNVVITRGRVPESFNSASPERIAFLHLDMNDAGAELSALDALFDRIVPGGVIILDDFGWSAYARQHDLESAWFSTRGYHVLELPTGQGMVIR